MPGPAPAPPRWPRALARTRRPERQRDRRAAQHATHVPRSTCDKRKRRLSWRCSRRCCAAAQPSPHPHPSTCVATQAHRRSSHAHWRAPRSRRRICRRRCAAAAACRYRRPSLVVDAFAMVDAAAARYYPHPHLTLTLTSPHPHPPLTSPHWLDASGGCARAATATAERGRRRSAVGSGGRCAVGPVQRAA